MLRYWRWTAPAALLLSAAITPAHAETLEELDAMAEIAVDEEAGIKFAQDQATRGELLGAIATLERVLALHPKSQSARFLHAVYLCRIDDQPGGAAELNKLKKEKFPEDLWAQALSICTLAERD